MCKGKFKQEHNKTDNMKKNFFRVVAMSALLALGVSGAQAQRSYDCPPLNPEWQTMADQVVNLNLEDPDKANKVFMQLSKKIRKNKEDLVAVGTYFLDKDNYPAASQCAKAVYDLDPTYIPGLMFSGEVFMKAQRWGDAGQKFDEVLTIDPNNVAALKRNAFVYKNVNPHVAIDALNKIKEIDPSYKEADKELGDIYYKLDKYKDAVLNYENYYKQAPKDDKLDIRSCENFLQSLYSQADFNRIIEVTTELLPIAPKDMVIRRMDFFAKVNKIGESIDLDGAIKTAEEASAYLNDPEYHDSIYISLDYEYAAALAKEKDDIPAAVAAYEKALEKDADKLNNYKELAKLYSRNKEADKAIATYQKYLEKKGDKVDVSDYFGLGLEYLKATRMTEDPAKKAEYIAAGDAAFNKVLEKEPGYYKAVMQQAALHITDASKPEEEPKALYEKALGMMPAEGDGKSTPEDVADANPFRLLAAQYLAFYYAQKEDFAGCRTYVDVMLKADPENAQAKNFDNLLKEMGK